MAARRRTTHRRRRSTRRRHNPGLGIKGFGIPSMEAVGAGIAGAVGSKFIVRKFIPQATGWMSPAATFGVAVGLGFLLKMAKMGRLASGVVTGGAIMAGIDALKLTPLGPQLAGVYVSPGGSDPVLSGGVGMFPAGFQDPSLAAGDENAPYGFQHGAETNYEDMY
jgi:hypothetical protein